MPKIYIVKSLASIGLAIEIVMLSLILVCEGNPFELTQPQTGEMS